MHLGVGLAFPGSEGWLGIFIQCVVWLGIAVLLGSLITVLDSICPRLVCYL